MGYMLAAKSKTVVHCRDRIGGANLDGKLRISMDTRSICKLGCGRTQQDA